MQTVVLDTNALLMPFEIKMNLDLELKGLLGDFRCVVPGPLIGELKHLDHKYAKAALQLARKYDIVQTTRSGDDAVIDVAIATNGYILTNDKKLRVAARKQQIPLIFLRSSTHLILEPAD
ncbi:ribonuclease VapC9 [Candidatus Methanoplasma termitum]|uniref:VapC9 protein n=1 Tax=Candidatus Methanoplasma termitum TaxID=1577791 RepID=A0A0A7LCV4_9ARCH|nr:PIN domain-containing protein [Candidatus Methanoplasma termitum]AIZ57000.1 ribonuclease VapC9 [Candidatus Methanoplasma termitum]MCL2334123.1 twitching motility protein PilT [Candidatus Methanoplasma sp.]